MVLALLWCLGMKTTNSKFTRSYFFIAMALLAVSMIGCADKDMSSNTTTATTGYTLVNGYCYDNSNTSVAVNSSYCSSTVTSTGYYYSNNQCYTTAGVAVANTHCGAIANTSGYSCVGYYYYYTVYNSVASTYCSGANCRGYTLFEYNTQRWVYCQ